MNEPKHTPAPWAYTPFRHDGARHPITIVSVAANSDHYGGCIANVSTPLRQNGDPALLFAERVANAHVIAAAPDMLAALEALVEYLEVGDKHYYTDPWNTDQYAALFHAKIAIDKARGTAVQL